MLNFAATDKFILDFLDTRREVLNWYRVFPGTVLITSRADLAALTGVIHVSNPWLWFTISEIDTARVNGFTNPQVWDFINNPKSSGRWE
jgi:hypothetical protein